MAKALGTVDAAVTLETREWTTWVLAHQHLGEVEGA